MLKIVLADTDLDNIRNFRTYIKLSFSEFRIVGSLKSSNDFLQEIKSLQPDLVVADIRFFGVLGYQIIRDTYETFPDIRFVLYGTYNDVEYMEKAMEFGVIDYMYRPVKPVDFERCLNRAAKVIAQIEEMNAEREHLTADYKSKLNLFKDRFLNSLIQGYLTDEREIRNSFKYFGIKLSPDYTSFIVRIDRFKKILLTMEEIDKHLLTYSVFLTVEDRVKKFESESIVLFNRFNQIDVIIGRSKPLFDLISFCDELKSDILTQCRTSVSIGIGRTYSTAVDISVSHKEAGAALRYRHYVGYNSVIPLHFVERLNNITYRYPIEKEELLVYSAVAGEYEYCEILLKQLLQSLKECGELPDKLVSKIVLDILVSINRFSDEQHIRQDSPFTTFFPSKDIFEIKTLDDAHKYLSSALKKYCLHMNDIRNNDKLNILNKAKKYIEDNFFENITLSSIAHKIETTPEFLGNIYIEYEKRSLYEYIIGVRMKKAKEFIKSTSLEDEDIAIKVGYQDVRHFRSIFRQYEGVSTNEYRNMYNPANVNNPRP